MYPSGLAPRAASVPPKEQGVIFSLHLRWPRTQGAGPPFIVLIKSQVCYCQETWGAGHTSLSP